MFNVAEAKKLLADLPQDDALNALDEITGWLASVKETVDFRPERRAEIIMLLDETAQPFHTTLLDNYLAEANLQDFNSMRMWQGVLIFMRALTDAYALCVEECQQEAKKTPTLQEKMPIIFARLLRATAEQIKLALMRYTEIERPMWEQLYQYYNLAVDNQLADTLVFAYAKGTPQTSSQRELLRAVLLHVASPASLAPDQIEVSFRIAARLSSFFDFTDVPEEDCAYCFDLADPSPPKGVTEKLQVTPTMRFFGALRAVPKLAEMIHEKERNKKHEELSGDNDFTPQGKLTVLKHLQAYWGKNHPYRRHERRAIETSIEVIHGFKIISKRVTNAELDHMTDLSEEEVQMMKGESTLNLTDAEENKEVLSESWDVLDISVSGIGGRLPAAASAWVKVGALCGLKATNSDVWWVGVIRRLETDTEGKMRVGTEILSKKPLSIWLRSLGKEAKTTSGWETSSGSFKYTYVPAILVADAQGSYAEANLLMESGSFLADYIFEVMMGEKSSNIKLFGLLVQGADFERISIQWLSPAT